LDDRDNESARFLTYMVAARQPLSAAIGEGILGMLQSRQPLLTESIYAQSKFQASGSEKGGIYRTA
jgi:ATP/maltotriose-dependent transcriptional regulator MalT